MTLFILLTGCATPTTKRVEVSDVAAEIEAEKQREIAFEAALHDKFRLVDTAYSVFVKSVPLCGEKTAYSIGTLVANKYMISEEMRTAAYAVSGITNVLKIIHVMRGSAAELVGIVDGDIPLSLNDWAIPTGENAGQEYLKKLEESTRNGEGISLRILRDGAETLFEITPDKTCDYTIVLSTQDIVNAYADGKNVIITRGMMRFTESDTELALVVSHELAHNVMNHMDAKTRNVVLGSVLDIVAAVLGVNTGGTFGNLGARAYSKEFEAEADYVGLYMMALSDLDFETAPHFWRRMAALHPGNIKKNHASTHPATPERFVALEKTVQEIKQKLLNGTPLEPEMKNDSDEE